MIGIATELATAVMGTLGFSMIFNVKRERLFAISIGGGLSWAVYLLIFYNTEEIFVSYFIASLTVAVYSEVIARIAKAPANIFLISSIIPLLPGGSLYYTMSALVSRDTAEFYAKGTETALSALGIATGAAIGFLGFTYLFWGYLAIMKRLKA